MSPQQAERVELLQGTLDMLVLRALLFGPLHGHAIATHIQRTSEEVLRVDHGSLYPAIHRLKKRLATEQSRWRRLARAIGLVMEPV